MTGVQIEHHTHDNGDCQQTGGEQHTAQQQRHMFPLRLTWPGNAKPLYEHLHQVFEEPHHSSRPSAVAIAASTNLIASRILTSGQNLEKL